jgi:hypothetical protein
LGFSNKEAHKSETLGLEPFLKASFPSKVTTSVPLFLNESPKSLDKLKVSRQKLKTQSPEEAKERSKKSSKSRRK